MNLCNCKDGHVCLVHELEAERDALRSQLAQARGLLDESRAREECLCGDGTCWACRRDAFLAEQAAPPAPCSCEAQGKEPHEDWCEESEWASPAPAPRCPACEDPYGARVLREGHAPDCPARCTCGNRYNLVSSEFGSDWYEGHAPDCPAAPEHGHDLDGCTLLPYHAGNCVPARR